MPEDNQTLAGYNSACDLVFYNAKKKKTNKKKRTTNHICDS